MSNTTQHTFTAEVAQLLQLLAHSLYSNPDVFLRELVSNSSDALYKRKILNLSHPEEYNFADPRIEIKLDDKNHSIIIKDNGIGMNLEEVCSLLGSLANSGTKKFLDALNNNPSGQKELVGQFGVGFYSAFVVADKVEVRTKKANINNNDGVLWVSDGQGAYETSPCELDEAGTEITLYLRDNMHEYTSFWRIKNIIEKYSSYIAFPVFALNDKGEMEQINQAKALWTLSRSEINDDDYKKLYSEISGDFGSEPLAWTHNKVEGSQEYTLLLYLPTVAPFDLLYRDMKKGVKLFVNRVYIMDSVDSFLPNYLRFIKGLVDAQNLPLNVSREMLQKNEFVENIKRGATKKVLEMFEKLSLDSEKYLKFFAEFGQVLKEGVIEDNANMERIEKLLRFNSTKNTNTSLDDYISRMKPDQKTIYYLLSDGLVSANASPHLEWFRKNDIEVLLLVDRIDDWMMNRMTKYNDYEFKLVAANDLDLPSPDSDDETSLDLSDFIANLKSVLEDKVADIVEVSRLVDSPVCIVSSKDQLAPHMVKLLRDAGQVVPEPKITLGINPKHAIIEKLAASGLVGDDLKSWAVILLDQAILLDRGTVSDPKAFVNAVNDLINR